MATSKDLLLAILSMDAYNRGYGAGISGLSHTSGTQIGKATIGKNAESNLSPGDAQATDFYAISYDISAADVDGFDEDTTVISYRGTDGNFWGEFFEVDVPIFIAGDFTQAELGLASQFFEAVDSSSSNSLYLTGHSLGGLAGLVAAGSLNSKAPCYL